MSLVKFKFTLSSSWSPSCKVHNITCIKLPSPEYHMHGVIKKVFVNWTFLPHPFATIFSWDCKGAIVHCLTPTWLYFTYLRISDLTVPQFHILQQKEMKRLNRQVTICRFISIFMQEIHKDCRKTSHDKTLKNVGKRGILDS